ncbi:hypothetical protein PUN28_013652 [Cardiocondyla obscurior]|uniref:Uncharacterized protein n=1 Tax=Cardiocondyla obscurior TaxID=286306 RepID=A0AAW2F4M0_9HYME
MAPPSETSDSFFLCLPRILQNEGAEGPTLHFRESPLTSLCYAHEMSRETETDKRAAANIAKRKLHRLSDETT